VSCKAVEDGQHLCFSGDLDWCAKKVVLWIKSTKSDDETMQVIRWNECARI
jgi:hypothetical protein